MPQILHARFNIHVKNKIDPKEIKKLEQILFDAGVWASGGDDPEIFFEESTNVMGVNIETDDDLLSLIETGAILGRCAEAAEKSGVHPGPTWFSIHDANGDVIETPYSPT
jgi:hypothetical protein